VGESLTIGAGSQAVITGSTSHKGREQIMEIFLGRMTMGVI